MTYSGKTARTGVILRVGLALAVSGALVPMAAPAAAGAPEPIGMIDGTPIIDRLDAAALPPGQVHRFWFRVTDNGIAQGWHVPVIVVRGTSPGPRLLLTAAIHGDELTGIDVIHQLTARIDPTTLHGTVVGVPGLNIPGLLHHSRGFTPDDGRDGENLNRLMPGKADAGASIGSRYAYRLWHGLLRPNADTAIDLHTQSRGTEYVMYAFAGSPRAREIAALIAPDIIKLDPGEKGTVELEMLNDGVPAITLELGRPEIFDATMAWRAVEGIGRVMIDLKMQAANSAPAAGTTPYVANAIVPVRATRGGFAHILAPLGSDVVKGQAVATISDAFGRIVETVKAPESGRVNTIATDPMRDPGDMLMRIVFSSPAPECAQGC
ncbi:succinylglutamate desuccinylase/aspartoacylase family protein [Sphingobium algorifonticola]|nr:succinylglutamate desuccinylase/aspartoacylase family protein [Sphingobium algorifonticola]